MRQMDLDNLHPICDTLSDACRQYLEHPLVTLKMSGPTRLSDGIEKRCACGEGGGGLRPIVPIHSAPQTEKTRPMLSLTRK